MRLQTIVPLATLVGLTAGAAPAAAIGVFLHGLSGTSGGATPGTETMAKDFAGKIPGTTYYGSWRAQDDAVKKIKAAKAANPSEPVVLVGHSYGGDSVNEVATDLKACGINVDVYIQIDTVGAFDDENPCNVLCGYNIYSTSNDGVNSEHDVTGSTNIPVDGTSHTGIDDKGDPGTSPDPDYRGKNGYAIVECILDHKFPKAGDILRPESVEPLIEGSGSEDVAWELGDDAAGSADFRSADAPVPVPAPHPLPCVLTGLSKTFNRTLETKFFCALDAVAPYYVDGGPLEAYLDANQGLLDSIDDAVCDDAALTPLQNPFSRFISGIYNFLPPGILPVKPVRVGLKVAPNPSNPIAHFQFEMDLEGPVELILFDMSGRRVATLLNDRFNVGAHEVIWNGYGDNGRHVPSGVYGAVLRTPEGMVTQKVVVSK